jgi:hypothetical protein
MQLPFTGGNWIEQPLSEPWWLSASDVSDVPQGNAEAMLHRQQRNQLIAEPSSRSMALAVALGVSTVHVRSLCMLVVAVPRWAAESQLHVVPSTFPDWI